MDFEECQEWGRRMRKEREELNARRAQIREEELKKMGIKSTDQNNNKPKYDHPSTPDDGFVTVIYIIGMIGSLIFNDFWIPWIIFTIAYGKFITRHNND